MSDDHLPDIEEQFQRLVASERQALVSMAMKLLGDLYQAEDVVQETLAAVLSKVRHDPPRYLRRYLFAALRRNALKARVRRKLQIYLGDAAEAVVDEYCRQDDEMPPELLEQAIEDLPPTQQTVIRMRYYTGLTFRQIGSRLSISINTVASRCRYALQAMRKNITSAPAEPGAKGDTDE